MTTCCIGGVDTPDPITRCCHPRFPFRVLTPVLVKWNLVGTTWFDVWKALAKTSLSLERSSPCIFPSSFVPWWMRWVSAKIRALVTAFDSLGGIRG
ncbi:hypothetical protein GQ53DRAFT_745092 [Thozetella sp. PMI_491]|nr:hypothetical protein GQ53DRAFT_745092 [Thozetella sp. PMI_491]